MSIRHRAIYQVNTKEEAFRIADDMLSSDYELDYGASQRAGYPIYTCTNSEEWISDLCVRLEVNAKNGTTNIWIKDISEQIRTHLVELSKQFGYTA